MKWAEWEYGIASAGREASLEVGRACVEYTTRLSRMRAAALAGLSARTMSQRPYRCSLAFMQKAGTGSSAKEYKIGSGDHSSFVDRFTINPVVRRTTETRRGDRA